MPTQPGSPTPQQPEPWQEVADITGLTMTEMASRCIEEDWPADAVVWWDDNHVYLVVKGD